MPQFETIGYRVEAPLARIALNRPEKLNAIDARMLQELNHALDLAAADDKVRAILLYGEGRAFSAGFDLNAGADAPSADREFWREELRRDFELIMRFWDSPKPTVAAVHKYCLGGAMELAVACDLTIAGADCRFGVPEVKFGSGSVALLLPWLAGPKAAKELLLTGDDRVSAERALAIGIVNRVVPERDLLDEAEAAARAIAGNDLQAVRLTKQAINRSLDIMGLRQALQEALEIDLEIETNKGDEAREFDDILRRDGVKAALRWRAGRIGG